MRAILAVFCARWPSSAWPIYHSESAASLPSSDRVGAHRGPREPSDLTCSERFGRPLGAASCRKTTETQPRGARRPPHTHSVHSATSIAHSVRLMGLATHGCLSVVFPLRRCTEGRHYSTRQGLSTRLAQPPPCLYSIATEQTSYSLLGRSTLVPRESVACEVSRVVAGLGIRPSLSLSARLLLLTLLSKSFMIM